MDGVLFLSIFPVTRPTSPLSCLVWCISGFPAPAHSFEDLFLLPNSLSSPAYSVSNYFALSCMISIWITLLYDFNLDYATSFFTCTYLCVFSKHVILLKYVLKLARNCHQHFTEYGYKLRLSKHKETKHQKPLEKIFIEDIQKSGKLSHPTN